MSLPLEISETYFNAWLKPMFKLTKHVEFDEQQLFGEIKNFSHKIGWCVYTRNSLH